MSGYTKLFSSILYSTIWREDNHVRLVWITMLAMADKNSIVEASIPGLSDMARISLDECLDALEKLKSPDPYSRTKEYDGRRIEDVDGGWFLLNHGKYRDLVTLQERRQQDAERSRRYRQRKADRDASHKDRDACDESRNITPPSPSPSPSPSPIKEKYIKRKKTQPTLLAYTDDFERCWVAYPPRKGKKTGKREAMVEFAALGTTRPSTDDLIAIIDQQKNTKDWQEENGAKVPDMHRWLKKRRFEDVILDKAPKKQEPFEYGIWEDK